MCIIYYIFVILKETKTLRYEDIISKYAVIRFCQFFSILRSLFCSSRYGSLFNQCEILNNGNFMIKKMIFRSLIVMSCKLKYHGKDTKLPYKIYKKTNHNIFLFETYLHIFTSGLGFSALMV